MQTKSPQLKHNLKTRPKNPQMKVRSDLHSGDCMWIFITPFERKYICS